MLELSFINFFIYLLSCYSITNFLTKSYLLKKIRPSYVFFHCNMCVGFWVGIILIVFNRDFNLFSFDLNIIDIILMGFMSSGFSYMLGTLFDDDGLRISKRGN